MSNFFKSISPYMKILNNNIRSMNDSKYFAGFIMIMLNIGSKFVSIKFSHTQETYLKYVLTKQLLIFSIAWMGTRDIYMALIITAVFTVLSDYVLNENSKLCILPESVKRIEKAMDLNNDGVISEDEINQSIKILEKARKMNTTQQGKIIQEKFHNRKRY